MLVDVLMSVEKPRFRWLFCPSRSIGNWCRFLGLNWQEVISIFLSLLYVAKYAQGMTTSNEANGIQLLYDGDGLAVIGEPTAVENFLASEGLASLSRLLPKVGEMIDGLGTLTEVASSVVETVSSLKDSATSIADSVSSMVDSANSVTESIGSMAETVGKWIKTSKEISKIVEKYHLKELGTPGVLQAVVGQLTTLTGATTKAAAGTVAAPAVVMSQMSMQQSLDEIKELIEAIDRKLNDVIQQLKNEVLSRMDGVRLAIIEANTIRDTVGRVSETTWSKVQNSSGTILETQARALRELGELANKFENVKNVAELQGKFEKLNIEVQKWIRVLADCFQLLDSIAVLELDRVLDASPDELDKHRLGLKAARQQRLALIANETGRLIERMNEVAATANKRVLFNPIQSKTVVKLSNEVTGTIQTFHKTLGVVLEVHDTDVRLWKDAASESLEKARETSAEGIKVVKQLGSDTKDQAQSIKGKLSGKIGDRLPQKHKDGGS